MIRMEEMKTEILPAKGEGIAKAAALLQRGDHFFIINSIWF